MSSITTICGYALADVRKSLREAIDHRDRRASQRWTAELVATPGAVGSLWASYWLAWASAGSPTLAILLKQSWAEISAKAHELQDWTLFRNDTDVRACAAESTSRLIDQPRQTNAVWPSKDITLYDVGTMRSLSPPVATDGPVVMSVWQRDHDALEHRMMAGRFLTALETGDLRSALSAVYWTMMTPVQQGLPAPLKCADRGPATLPLKARSSPLWFWLDIGRAFLQQRAGHRGWLTMHSAVADAFRTNYKRWTTVERMRLLLAWILQLRSSLTPQPDSIWAAAPIQQSLEEIDLPYKEVAAELADPNSVITRTKEKPKEMSQKSRSEAKMAEADAAIAAAMGLTEDV